LLLSFVNGISGRLKNVVQDVQAAMAGAGGENGEAVAQMPQLEGRVSLVS
jgi:hypothetical protein